MSHFSLRPHQVECINALRQSISRGVKRLLVKAPCSFGKTIVFCSIAKSAKDKNSRTLIIVDNIALVRQTILKLLKFVNESDVGVYCATIGSKSSSKLITVATIQSISKSNSDFDIFICDEVHDGLNRVIKFFNDRSSVIIGFTATPFNAKGEPIYGKEDSFFKELTYSVSAKEMLAENFITPMKYGGESEETKIDLSKIRIINGDYDMSQAEDAFLAQKDKMILQVDDMMSRINGRGKIIIMTTGIRHANELEKMIPGSIAYHSDIEDILRKEILEEFEYGKHRFLIGVMAIYKGLDITCVDCIVNMRPIRSFSLYTQLAGRGVRLHEFKNDCLFLDYGQTVEKLGFYEEFDEKNRKEKEKIEGVAPVKKCPECRAIVFASCNECVECGHKFPVAPLKVLEKLDFVAYQGEEHQKGIISEVELSESWFCKTIRVGVIPPHMIGTIYIDFKYSLSSDIALKIHEKHSRLAKKGMTLIWKKAKGKYNNIVSIT